MKTSYKSENIEMLSSKALLKILMLLEEDEKKSILTKDLRSKLESIAIANIERIALQAKNRKTAA